METVKSGLTSRLAYAPLIWVIAFLTLQPTAIAQVDFVASGTVDWEDYWHEEFHADEDEMIIISFHSNAPIDVLLIDFTDYPEYARVASQGWGTFDYYRQGSRLNTTGENYTFRIPQEGTYAFVVDNTRVPERGAESGTNVRFSIEARSQPRSPEPLTYSSNFPILEIIAAVVVVVSTILVLLLVLFTTRKKEREGVPLILPMRRGEPAATQMICSNCSNLVPIGTFCSRCGKRLQ